MGMLADWEIIDRVNSGNLLIEPFSDGEKIPGVVSYGLTSYGYDLRLGEQFKIPNRLDSIALDPKNPQDARWESFGVPRFTPLTIQPHGFVLAESLERLRIPRDCLAIVVGKSTYARLGLVVNTTPLEPEWEGVVTLELSNTTPLPLRVYPGEGIAQVVFYTCGQGGFCRRSYADKKGRYQNQTGVTLSKVD